MSMNRNLDPKSHQTVAMVKIQSIYIGFKGPTPRPLFVYFNLFIVYE